MNIVGWLDTKTLPKVGEVFFGICPTSRHGVCIRTRPTQACSERCNPLWRVEKWMPLKEVIGACNKLTKYHEALRLALYHLRKIKVEPGIPNKAVLSTAIDNIEYLINKMETNDAINRTSGTK